VNLLFNQTTPPAGTNPGDYKLLANATVGSTNLSAVTVPPLVPGATYYLAVQNTVSPVTIGPFPPQTSDVKAYQVGFGIGNGGLVYGPAQGLVYGTTSKRNAWEVRTYWQHIEQYALDPNLLDSDFFEGRGNLQGIYLAVAYGLADNVIATARYGYASRINDKIGTGGSNQDIPQVNPIQHYNLLQLDLTFRF